jgi:uncharacterized protein
MALSMYQASIPVVQKLLANLDHVLEKAIADAAARKIDHSVFMQSRLAPDMFAFARQVQLTADFGKWITARLAGVEPPRTEDKETNLDDLRARLASMQSYIAGFTASQIDGSEDRTVVFKAGPREMKFTGKEFLLSFGLPNFYFHYTMAYAILRHNGVQLGKSDYVQGKV